MWVQAALPGIGKLQAKFHTQRIHTSLEDEKLSGKQVPILLHGHAQIGRSTKRVSAIIHRNVIEFFLTEVKVRAGSLRSRSFKIRAGIAGNNAGRIAVRSVPVTQQAVNCGVESMRTNAAGQNALIYHRSANKQVRVATVATLADSKWFGKFGMNSKAKMAQFVNAAEAVFDEQLGIRFDIVGLHVVEQNDPYLEYGIAKKINAFMLNESSHLDFGMSEESWRHEVDIKHMFTYADYLTGTVGYAISLVSCLSPIKAYSISMHVELIEESLLPTVVAHEIGHNFSADHDSSDNGDRTIMGVRGRVTPDRKFSSFSLGQINAHLAENNSCLDTSIRPAYTPTSIPALTATPTQRTPVAPTLPPLRTATPTRTVDTPAATPFYSISKKRIRIGKQTFVQIVANTSGGYYSENAMLGFDLVLGAKRIGRAEADADGKSVFLLKFGPKSEARYTLLIRSTDKTWSRRFSVIKPKSLKRPTHGISKQLNWRVVTLR